MSFTVDGADISTCRLTIPRWGAWIVEVSTAGPHFMAPGSRVEIQLGTMLLSGTVRSGDTFVESSAYLIAAGADNLKATIPERPYRNDGQEGILLSSVVNDIAEEVGEVADVREDRSLGYAWPRTAGPAWEALHVVTGGSWWSDLDGTIIVGSRPSVEPSGVYQVASFSPSRGTAKVYCDDDDYSGIVPGSTIDVEGTPYTIGTVTMHVTPGSMWAEVRR